MVVYTKYTFQVFTNNNSLWIVYDVYEHFQDGYPDGFLKFFNKNFDLFDDLE